MFRGYNGAMWEKSHTLSVHSIGSAAIVQIAQSREKSDILVFTEDGWVNHIDGFKFSKIGKYQVAENKVICVEEIKVRNTRVFIVADVEGNLFAYNSSFDASVIDLGRRSGPVTAIEDIGAGRVLISYANLKGGTTVEMIAPLSGAVLRTLNLSEIERIRDFHCPSAFYGSDNGWLLAGADQTIEEIKFKKNELQRGETQVIHGGMYVDEIWCSCIKKHVVGKHLFEDLDDDPSDYEHIPIAESKEEKRSCVSYDFDTKIIIEAGCIYINEIELECTQVVDLGKDALVVTHLHFPKGRICLGTSTGKLIVVDYRMNSIRFISDA